MDPKTAALQFWKSHLESEVTSILRDGKTRNFEENMGMYTIIYDWCQSDGRLKNAPYLYNHISHFLTEYAQEICIRAPADDTSLLEYYDEQWDRFWRGAKVVNRHFAYLNRHYVIRMDDAQPSVKTVGNMALDSWKAHVFEALLLRLKAAGADSAALEAVQVAFQVERLLEANLGEMRIVST
ncbi:Cullin repeat-like-containing domain protein [Mycena crocata]|nr:Cullin repeat-like-containing domain protein [Mycena crocata]